MVSLSNVNPLVDVSPVDLNPGFHPLYFKSAKHSGLKLSDAEKIQIIFEVADDEMNQGLEVGTILLLPKKGQGR